VNNNISVVASDEITWISSLFKADPTSSSSMFETLKLAWYLEDFNLQILNKRKNYADSIKFLQSQIPQDVRVNTLEVDKTGLTVIVNSSSLLSINKFLDNIIGLALNKKFLKNILIESLSLSPKSGYYILSIKAVLI
jgi:hypothetical protein